MDLQAFDGSFGLIIAQAVTSVALLVEQWFLNTVLTPACTSHASFVRLLAVFQ